MYCDVVEWKKYNNNNIGAEKDTLHWIAYTTLHCHQHPPPSLKYSDCQCDIIYYYLLNKRNYMQYLNISLEIFGLIISLHGKSFLKGCIVLVLQINRVPSSKSSLPTRFPPLYFSHPFSCLPSKMQSLLGNSFKFFCTKSQFRIEVFHKSTVWFVNKFQISFDMWQLILKYDDVFTHFNDISEFYLLWMDETEVLLQIKLKLQRAHTAQ